MSSHKNKKDKKEELAEIESGYELLEEGAKERTHVHARNALIVGLVLLALVGIVLLSVSLSVEPVETKVEQGGEVALDAVQREDTWVLDVPPNDVLIKMNGGKYIPDNLTVEAGMTIAFANEDETKEYWPISSTHPNLFDLKSAIPSGAFYSFTITDEERIEFSDKLYPEVSGVITSLESQK